MELPKFHETFNPILEILSDGKVMHHRELINKVVERYYSHLPIELLNEKTKSGEQLILNRIAWGKSYLKKAGYIIYPERGFVQITEKGVCMTKKIRFVGIDYGQCYMAPATLRNPRMFGDIAKMVGKQEMILGSKQEFPELPLVLVGDEGRNVVDFVRQKKRGEESRSGTLTH